MVGTPDTGLVQLSLDLDKLDRLLDEHPGSQLPLPITASEIGGELLSILSKGLYTNPLDSIREYVQNAVDAGAQNITIKITGSSAIIFDDGEGMSLKEILGAREFGLSRKSLTEHVGFRGIGIYSGFDLSQHLRITTKKAGDSYQHVLVFDFGAMRSVLDRERLRNLGDPKTSLIELLSAHTHVEREPTYLPPDRHFTNVQLDGISDVHIRKLSNRAQLRGYLQSLPVDFADDFPYRSQVNSNLSRHVDGYRPIRIKLQSDDQPEELIDKYSGLNLQSPRFGFISTDPRQPPVAYYWACLNAESGRLQPRPRSQESDETNGDRPRYEGFVYKMKGFTIGDQQRIRLVWDKFNGKPGLYHWYTGEVYILDPEIIPNAERDDFETNQAKTQLEVALGQELKKLLRDAEAFQVEGRADQKIQDYVDEVGQITKRIATDNHPDDASVIGRLGQIKTDLVGRKKKASPDKRPIADQLATEIDRLHRQLFKDVRDRTPEGDRRKRAAKNKSVADRPQISTPAPMPTTASYKTLQELLRDAGWEVDGDVARLADAVQASLDDVLTVGSVTYRSFLDDIETRINPNDIGE